MELVIGSFVIRLINAALWSVVIYRILRDDRPVTPLARRLISLVIFGGFWALVLGGLTPFGMIQGEIARLIYTSYTAVSGIIALALVLEGEA